MEFLVRIDIRTPHDLDPGRLAQLQSAETARARELMAAGLLKRIWRIPGRRSNVSLYEAPDATALHAALTSLRCGRTWRSTSAPSPSTPSSSDPHRGLSRPTTRG